jgi:tetratricopeptide (TPR) repeat protein
LAETLKAMGRLQEAEDIYRQTTQKWTNDRVAKNGLANLLRRKGEYSEALSLLPDIPSDHSSQSFYDFYIRGAILTDMDKIDEAIAIFNIMLDNATSEPQKKIFRHAIALAELKRMNIEKSISILKQLPENDVSMVMQLHALAAMEKMERVRSLYNKLKSAAQAAVMVVVARTVFNRIEKAYCLNSEKGFCHPPLKEYNELITLESDMILASYS